MFPLQGARVWSLVRKLRSCMPCHMAQKREIIHNTLVDLESGRVCRLAVPGIMWGTTIRMKRQYKIAISHYCNQVDVTLTRSGSNLRWCQGQNENSGLTQGGVSYTRCQNLSWHKEDGFVWMQASCLLLWGENVLAAASVHLLAWSRDGEHWPSFCPESLGFHTCLNLGNTSCPN